MTDKKLKPKPPKRIGGPKPPEKLKMTMQKPEVPKPKVKSKTIWGIVTTVVGVVATSLGFGPDDVEFLRDGFQLEDITPLIVLIGTVLTAYGIRAAKQPID